MAWKQIGQDRKIEIVVDPDFRGDLLALARERPVWIVETVQNWGRISAVWQLGGDANLCEVSKFTAGDLDRENSLISILDDVDLHHGYTRDGSYDGLVIHGLLPSERMQRVLGRLGFQVGETTADGFIALGRLSEEVRMRQVSEI